jgi:hypothetical protein
MNDLATHQAGTSVVVPGGNAFEAYGQSVSQKSIVGDILKFTKFGEWVSGKDETEMADETKLIANMDELLVGWVRWEDSKPTDQIMGKVAEAFRPARRNELGDTDEAAWETDDNGVPQDPWRLTNYLVLKEPGGEQLYTYATSSRSGLNAVGELCKVYGKQMRQRPDDYPVVELQASSYIHPKYKKIFTPQLIVSGWSSKAEFAEAMESASQAEKPAEEAPADAKKKAGAGATKF